MNESNFAHAGLALLAQMMTALMATALGADLLSAVVMGGLFAVGFYFGREVAQARRRGGAASMFASGPWTRSLIFSFPSLSAQAFA